MTLLLQATEVATGSGAIIGQWGAPGAIILALAAYAAWMTRQAMAAEAKVAASKDMAADKLAAERAADRTAADKHTERMGQLVTSIDALATASRELRVAVDRQTGAIDGMRTAIERRSSSTSTRAVPT